jgi:hypothetical protein
MTATQTRRGQSQGTKSGLMWLLFLLDAGLLIASGAIHLHLWDIAYRHVPTLDVLFLVQAAGAIVAAIVLLVTRHLLIVTGCALLMAGTIAGFLLARSSAGIFGFHLTFSSTEAYVALAVEAAAVVMLIITGLVMRQRK